MPVTVAIIMGSQSDWETMSHAAATLRDLGISAGVTMLNDADEAADVLTRADAAMYQRKLERRAARRRGQ